jgi:phosphonate transport system substrate-binding protein
MLLAGQIDAAWICGYPFVRHRDALTAMAVPVRRGRPLYHTSGRLV